MDAKYLKYEKCPDEIETLRILSQVYPKMGDFDKADQCDRLIKKYESYHDAYYKWWILVICFGFGLLGWASPEMMLKGRAMLVKTESEEDVLQLQTIIGILMNTSCDTLDALHWMQRQSIIHKSHLIVAYHDYPSDANKALTRLKLSDLAPEWIRMVNKLMLTVHQISLADAFADIVSERQHMMRMREIAMESSIDKKRGWASMISLAPLTLVSVLCLVVPLGILGFQEFTKAMSESNGF